MIRGNDGHRAALVPALELTAEGLRGRNDELERENEQLRTQLAELRQRREEASRCRKRPKAG